MTQPARKKSAPWVWPALLLTIAATAWITVSEDPEGEPMVLRAEPAGAGRAKQQDTRSEFAAALPLFTPRVPIEYDPEDLFPGDPPTLEPDEAAPAKPTTPPLPYTYAGRLIEHAQPIVFLQRGNHSLAVRSGEVIDGVWRLDEVTQTSLSFSYLPLGTAVPLTFGVSN